MILVFVLIKKPAGFMGGFYEKDRTTYFFAETRLNFVVNFSTRPAVSTKRFSPV